jgi:hypothetical protein
VSRLREAAVACARTGAHPLLSVERLLATERVAAALEARRMNAVDAWSGLVAGAVDKGIAALIAADVRRLLAGIWTDRVHARLAGPLVDRALALDRCSIDRALITAYLRDYPTDHIAFEPLRAAAAAAADRRDWPWRDAGRTWRLWDGPAALGAALHQAAEPHALLRATGFGGRLGDGAFVSAARADAARLAR